MWLVVLLGMMVVLCWCKESVGVCVSEDSRMVDGEGDVVFVVVCVVFDVVCDVI